LSPLLWLDGADLYLTGGLDKAALLQTEQNKEISSTRAYGVPAETLGTFLQALRDEDGVPLPLVASRAPSRRALLRLRKVSY
jgi:hypothetical protein